MARIKGNKIKIKGVADVTALREILSFCENFDTTDKEMSLEDGNKFEVQGDTVKFVATVKDDVIIIEIY